MSNFIIRRSSPQNDKNREKIAIKGKKNGQNLYALL
jgi:hypothetical protein